MSTHDYTKCPLATEVEWLKKIGDEFDKRMDAYDLVEGAHYSTLGGKIEELRIELVKFEGWVKHEFTSFKNEFLTKKEYKNNEKHKKNAWKWAIGLIPPYIGLIVTIVVLIKKLP